MEEKVSRVMKGGQIPSPAATDCQGHRGDEQAGAGQRVAQPLAEPQRFEHGGADHAGGGGEAGFNGRREAEPLVEQDLDALVKPGDRVVDVGSNVGIYTEQLARCVGPRGEVYAFEPDPTNYARLAARARR
jgi:hypothetical protein